MTAQERRRFERQVEVLHALGPRPLGELLFALARALDGEAALGDLLEDFARLSPDVAQAVGADRFPTAKLRQVPADLIGRAA